jgi:hypothetical protein
MGLSNHRCACLKWKTVARLTRHREKRRRLEIENDMRPNSGLSSEAPGPAQLGDPDLTVEVCNDLLWSLSITHYQLEYN